MRLFSSMLVVVALVTTGTLALAQKPAKPVANHLTVADLEKAATAPTLEQSILRAAADKLDQERRPMETIELQLATTVSLLPNGCYQICVGSGLRRACVVTNCNPTK